MKLSGKRYFRWSGIQDGQQGLPICYRRAQRMNLPRWARREWVNGWLEGNTLYRLRNNLD